MSGRIINKTPTYHYKIYYTVLIYFLVVKLDATTSSQS